MLHVASGETEVTNISKDCEGAKNQNQPTSYRQVSITGMSASDPKGIEPSKRVKEFPNEHLKVSAGKLFCSAYREELGLKSSTIHNYI